MRIFLLIVCFAVSETISGRVERSFGGSPIAIEDAPYFVSIKEYNRHKCGGSLITWEHVITTASCVVDDFDKLNFHLIVVSGASTIYGWGGTERAITKFSAHSRFMLGDRTPDFDITVLKLSKYVPMDGKHWPILLPIVPPAHSELGSLIAFGNTGFQTTNIYLHKLPVLIWSPTLSTYIQAGYDPKHSYIFYGRLKYFESSDNGDIGGPLVHNNTLIGVASRVVTPSGRVFINLYEHSPFISEAFNDL